LFSIYVLFGVLFYLLFVLLVSSRRCLDVSLFEELRGYEVKTLRSRKQEARQVTLDHIDPMCSLFLSSSHIILHALILLPKPHTFGISVSYLVSLFILYDVEFGLCFCESVVVFHPSRCEMTV
jgi:hypothetical protein